MCITKDTNYISENHNNQLKNIFAPFKKVSLNFIGHFLHFCIDSEGTSVSGIWKTMLKIVTQRLLPFI